MRVGENEPKSFFPRFDNVLPLALESSLRIKHVKTRAIDSSISCIVNFLRFITSHSVGGRLLNGVARSRQNAAERSGKRFFVELFAFFEVRRDQLGQIHNALRIAPLVVIPRDNLQHVVSHDHGERGVDRRGDIRASEVAGHERLVSDSQDTLELAVGSLTEGGVDFIGGDLLGGLDNQIDDGDVRRRHAERDAVELTLELREHERDSLGGTGGGRHNVQGGGTGTAQVTVGRIEDALVTSVRVGGGHQALDETKLFVEHLDERRETVGGAGRVGDDLVGVLVLVSVDTEHVGRDVVTLGRGGDHNLLGTRSKVLGGARGVDEDAGTFNDNVDTESRPRELERVTGGDNFDHLAVDGDVGVVDNLDVGFKGAEDRVVLDQVGGLLDSARVVDGDNVEHRVGASVPAAQEVAANAAETVNSNLAGLALHGGNGLGASRLGGGLALDATGEGLFRLGRESRGGEARERLRSRGKTNKTNCLGQYIATFKRFVSSSQSSITPPIIHCVRSRGFNKRNQ